MNEVKEGANQRVSAHEALMTAQGVSGLLTMIAPSIEEGGRYEYAPEAFTVLTCLMDEKVIPALEESVRVH